MSERKTVLMTVRSDHGPPSLAEAAGQVGVSLHDLNAEFGVVAVDPSAGTFAVEVYADRLPEGKAGKEGPFSNPRIEPFGPPKP